MLVIVGAGETVSVCVTVVAALKFALPAWLTVSVVDPLPTIFTVPLVATVATLVLELA